jgi:hypothetical protein
MYELSSKLNWDWAQRIADGQDAATNAVARFQAEHSQAGSIQVPQRCKTCCARPDNQEIDTILRHIASFAKDRIARCMSLI